MHKAHRKWKNSRMQGVMAFNSYVVNYKHTTFHFHEIGMVRFNGDHRLVVGNTNGTIECRQSGKRMHRQPERLSTGRDCCCPDREDVVFLQISVRKAGRITDMSVRYPFFFFFPYTICKIPAGLIFPAGNLLQFEPVRRSLFFLHHL